MRGLARITMAALVAILAAAGCSDDADSTLDQAAGGGDACADWSGLDSKLDRGAAVAVDHASFHPDIHMSSEKVTCVFAGATGVESCRTTYFGPACQGKGSCDYQRSGYKGQKLTWQSSCGGTATTLMDGKDETVTFTCAGVYQVTDKVTCLFTGSTSTQNCSSIKGSCQGKTSCTMSIKANLDAVLDWTSSCGGRRKTTMDWKDDQVSFVCGQATASEIVTCVFKGGSGQNDCFAASLPGYPGCKGTGSCTLKVSGKTGQGVQWKSTCGGYAHTIIDGKDENAEFTCK